MIYLAAAQSTTNFNMASQHVKSPDTVELKLEPEQDETPQRGRKKVRDDEDEDEDGAQPTGERKRKRSRKGGEKKYLCPQDGCGKSYSRAEHLYRHQLNRMWIDFSLPMIKLTFLQTRQSASTTATFQTAIDTLYDRISVFGIETGTPPKAPICNERKTIILSLLLIQIQRQQQPWYRRSQKPATIPISQSTPLLTPIRQL